MCPAQPSKIQAPAIRRELEKILSHELFARSERMARFLRFVVEHWLAGKSGELKEYVIGVEVFDRGPNYDPRVDPIVRVEARRLRSKLKAYYAGAGAADPLRIEFRSGSYSPLIEEPEVERAVAHLGRERATLAVMPFVNLSAGQGHDYFSDGLTEELIHALTKAAGMRVVAWDSAARMRGRQQDLAAIRQSLGVAAALTGSVRIAGSAMRVRAQLIDTETGVFLWSETFDRNMEDVFAVQEDIARAIVRILSERFGAPQKHIPSRGRSSITSYDWYLKGRYVWHKRTPEDLARSVQYFENAIAADSQSALAFTGLADAYSLLADYGLMHPSESMPKARTAASRAIELDPHLAEAYVSLGFIRGQYDWDWEESGRFYERAIQLNPGYATAHYWLGVNHHCLLRELDAALQEVRIAVDLDPLSSIIREGISYLFMLQGRYGEAIDGLRELIAFDPDFYKAYTSMGRAYAQAGEFAKAIDCLERGRRLVGDLPSIVAALGQVEGLAGKTERARERLTELNRHAVEAYVPCTSFALIHLGLGEKEQALSWLERACERKELPLCSIGVHPIYDALRPEPRFRALLQCLRLPG